MKLPNPSESTKNLENHKAEDNKTTDHSDDDDEDKPKVKPEVKRVFIGELNKDQFKMKRGRI